MARSLKKDPHVDLYLLKKIDAACASNDKHPIKTWSRCSTILPDFIGLVIVAHSGRTHVPVFASDNVAGHRLGEFSLTRIFKGRLVDKKVKKR